MGTAVAPEPQKVTNEETPDILLPVRTMGVSNDKALAGIDEMVGTAAILVILFVLREQAIPQAALQL